MHNFLRKNMFKFQFSTYNTVGELRQTSISKTNQVQGEIIHQTNENEHCFNLSTSTTIGVLLQLQTTIIQ